MAANATKTDENDKRNALLSASLSKLTQGETQTGYNICKAELPYKRFGLMNFLFLFRYWIEIEIEG